MNTIAEQRKKLGISQSVLADVIGWGQSRVANYELSIRKPGLDECRMIVLGLNKLGANCSLDDVFPPGRVKR
ncbi:helix-turn-helix transcriptional regulator [Pantoea sp. OVA07A]|uniref:helix-turn-helix transcriptional regulator n=1 Tax=Pantoea sp. OVA07A TaxID=2862677 RepID=UPI001CC02BC3|nr:helix-turn-helix transcriptional regulator [Pantoea sp. OVA07A]